MRREWNSHKKYNPFNSFKLIAHVDRWTLIREGDLLPPPVLVTIDPTNACNYNCVWCNARQVINQRARYLSESACKIIVDILRNWRCSVEKYRVKAVCIAGGGEPLLNSNTNILIDDLVNNDIEVGVVTNGSLIHGFIDSLSKCHWVSVSVDSGTPETFSKLKNTSLNQFDKVIKNMQELVAYSKRNETYLDSHPLSFGVTYKFLVHKENVKEIEMAAKIAKSIGCKSMHIRPVGRPWYESNSETFNSSDIEIFNEELMAAQELDDENFSVYGITHKFTDDFQPNNNFLKCYGVFMTTVFMPPKLDDSPDSFVLSQCCDRRGDSMVELAHNLTSMSDVYKNWGSERHWDIHKKIKVKYCPRCTFSPHNEIYEEVICKDNMSINFI